jgi:cytochrome c
MTGPSLAGLFGRKAGALASFSRYSPAMKAAQHVWDDSTLDSWLTDPAAMIPGNRMTFPGIKDASARKDLLAFLKDRTAPGRAAENNQNGDVGSMMGVAAPTCASSRLTSG